MVCFIRLLKTLTVVTVRQFKMYIKQYIQNMRNIQKNLNVLQDLSINVTHCLYQKHHSTLGTFFKPEILNISLHQVLFLKTMKKQVTSVFFDDQTTQIYIVLWFYKIESLSFVTKYGRI